MWKNEHKMTIIYLSRIYLEGLGLHFVRYNSATAFVNTIINSVTGLDLIGQEYCKLFIFPTQNVSFFSFSLISCRVSN